MPSPRSGACLSLILRADGQASLSHLTNTCTWTEQEMCTHIIILVMSRSNFQAKTHHPIFSEVGDLVKSEISHSGKGLYDVFLRS